MTKHKNLGRHWIRIHKDSKDALENLKLYFDNQLEKVTNLQIISLKIFDFQNNHFFENDEPKLARSGWTNCRSMRLYKQYFRNVRGKLRSMRKIVKGQIRLTTLESDEINDLLSLLNKKKPTKGKTVQIKAIYFFKGILEELSENLLEQDLLLSKILSSFKRFIGDAKMWQLDCDGNQRKGPNNVDLYLYSQEEKEKLIEEWKNFIEMIKEIKLKVRKEVKLIPQVSLNNDLANWSQEILSGIRTFTTLEYLKKYKSDSQRITAMMKLKVIDTYHATESSESPFPLLESRFRLGFYVCTHKKKYAMNIKAHQSVSMGMRIRIIKIIIPKIIFDQLFIEDPNYGISGDELSEEAYQNAYLLPVSNFPKFNKLFYQGVIFVK